MLTQPPWQAERRYPCRKIESCTMVHDTVTEASVWIGSEEVKMG